MMRFAYLGSGSKGNAALVQCGATTIMVDCGLPLPEVELRLRRLGMELDQLDGIVVTHEHSDHVNGIARLVQRRRMPVWLTPGSLKGWPEARADSIRLISPHEAFAIGDLQVEPFPVPHDAREPCQYVFGDGRLRLGLVSDAGAVTQHMRHCLSACDALLVEFNHDPIMLQKGPYPGQLKRRVGGDRGHLSNAQAANLLRNIDCTRLQHLVLIHLSEVNNTPAHARAAAAAALGCDESWIACAHQQDGLPWRELR